MRLDTDATEPKACITLRLGELEELMNALETAGRHPLSTQILVKLRKMRVGLLESVNKQSALYGVKPI